MWREDTDVAVFGFEGMRNFQVYCNMYLREKAVVKLLFLLLK